MIWIYCLALGGMQPIFFSIFFAFHLSSLNLAFISLDCQLRARRALWHCHYSKMFHWEPEGCYHHRLCTAIVPFWFSMEHLWISMAPFWLSTDDICRLLTIFAFIQNQVCENNSWHPDRCYCKLFAQIWYCFNRIFAYNCCIKESKVSGWKLFKDNNLFFFLVLTHIFHKPQLKFIQDRLVT